jgi:hypothetical protein
MYCCWLSHYPWNDHQVSARSSLLLSDVIIAILEDIVATEDHFLIILAFQSTKSYSIVDFPVLSLVLVVRSPLQQ